MQSGASLSTDLSFTAFRKRGQRSGTDKTSETAVGLISKDANGIESPQVTQVHQRHHHHHHHHDQDLLSQPMSKRMNRPSDRPAGRRRSGRSVEPCCRSVSLGWNMLALKRLVSHSLLGIEIRKISENARLFERSEPSRWCVVFVDAQTKDLCRSPSPSSSSS